MEKSTPGHAPCNVDECDRASSAKGMCKLHYGRWHRLGSLELPSRVKPPCQLEGCDRPSNTKGLCRAHYHRQWRTGSAGEVEISDRTRKPCSMPDCDKLADGGRGYCSKHYQRVRTHGDPTCAPPRVSGPAHPSWLPDVAVTYTAAHKRVTNARGRAVDHKCAGCPAQAEHWSYDHSDLNESFDDRGIAFSVDVSRYRPLCVPCHKKFDMSRFPSRGMTAEQRRARRLELYAANRNEILAAQRAERARRKQAALLADAILDRAGTVGELRAALAALPADMSVADLLGVKRATG